MGEVKTKPQIVRDAKGRIIKGVAQDTNKNGTAGAPTKYKPEYCQKIIEFMQSDGKEIYKPFSVKDEGIVDHHIGYLPRFFEEFATEIGVDVGTVLDWCKRHPDFSQAYKVAKDIQLTRFVGGMMSGVYIPSATIFTLKNMFRWTDREAVEHSGSLEVLNAAKKEASTLTDEELDAELAEAAKT